MADKGIMKALSGVATAQLGGGSAPQPSIVFTNPMRDEPHVSAWTLALLAAVMAKAGVKRIYITSTYRDPKDQARVMFGNLTPGKSMYGGYGKRVEQVARNMQLMDDVGTAVAEGLAKLPGLGPSGFRRHTADEVVARMADEIKRLEGHHGMGCVSRHQMDPAVMNVIDISQGSLTPQSKLAAFIGELTASTRIARIGLPKGSMATHAKHFVETQPCIHLEIPQPIDGIAGGAASRTA